MTSFRTYNRFIFCETNTRLIGKNNQAGHLGEQEIYKKGKVVSRQPIFIVNLKSNTMKNT